MAPGGQVRPQLSLIALGLFSTKIGQQLAEAFRALFWSVRARLPFKALGLHPKASTATTLRHALLYFHSPGIKAKIAEDLKASKI